MLFVLASPGASFRTNDLQKISLCVECLSRIFGLNLSSTLLATAAHPGAAFEEGDFSAGEAHIVDESVAHRAAFPSAFEQGGATGQHLSADSAVFRFKTQQE